MNDLSALPREDLIRIGTALWPRLVTPSELTRLRALAREAAARAPACRRIRHLDGEEARP